MLLLPSVHSLLALHWQALEAEYHPLKNNPPDDAEGYCAAVQRSRGYVAPDWSDA